jgi:hypothetical protein
MTLIGEEDEPPARPALMWVWSAATGIGVGLGWYLVQSTRVPLLVGVPVGICQGLVLVRNRQLALLWAGVTSGAVGLALIFFTPLGAPLLIGSGWVSVDINGPILLLTFIGVPAVAYAQFLALIHWAGSDGAIRWFGASVFSFPIVALFGWLLNDIWAPDNLLHGLINVQPFEPRLWVIGAAWGVCTGWAMSKMPEVVEPNNREDSEE